MPAFNQRDTHRWNDENRLAMGGVRMAGS
jgi:hypothetical protein